MMYVCPHAWTFSLEVFQQHQASMVVYHNGCAVGTVAGMSCSRICSRCRQQRNNEMTMWRIRLREGQKRVLCPTPCCFVVYGRPAGHCRDVCDKVWLIVRGVIMVHLLVTTEMLVTVFDRLWGYLWMCTYKCVCVFVCVWQREREREKREQGSIVCRVTFILYSELSAWACQTERIKDEAVIVSDV